MCVYASHNGEQTLEAREEAPFYAFVFLATAEPMPTPPPASLPPLDVATLNSTQLSATSATYSQLSASTLPSPPARMQSTLTLAKLLPILDEAASLERLVFARGVWNHRFQFLCEISASGVKLVV